MYQNIINVHQKHESFILISLLINEFKAIVAEIATKAGSQCVVGKLRKVQLLRQWQILPAWPDLFVWCAQILIE